ncbi:DivIVA domain-containing protein [Micromonospora sp. DR5-3]|uniref:DivIVA domain-containing protein n=1 Tax=unclassified Micromonospora TaxID=2617518 RepID=UPI0011DB7325|nr:MULTISPECIES: DivIVA domain-containing protein [unclassified Micromonospora]MCW3815845.1 DivIVA domain-containing protein [Micromonospora sp. DR5-3]TYC24362.1 DivIVA domain-containing protein [Micromonospora sp. MP36]
MTVYRSRHALRGPFTPDRIATLRLPTARRGYRVDEVDALLHRLAYELHRRTGERDEARAENQRIKDALRRWQSAEAARRLGS